MFYSDIIRISNRVCFIYIEGSKAILIGSQTISVLTLVAWLVVWSVMKQTRSILYLAEILLKSSLNKNCIFPPSNSFWTVLQLRDRQRFPQPRWAWRAAGRLSAPSLLAACPQIRSPDLFRSPGPTGSSPVCRCRAGWWGCVARWDLSKGLSLVLPFKSC